MVLSGVTLLRDCAGSYHDAHPVRDAQVDVLFLLDICLSFVTMHDSDGIVTKAPSPPLPPAGVCRTSSGSFSPTPSPSMAPRLAQRVCRSVFATTPINGTFDFKCPWTKDRFSHPPKVDPARQDFSGIAVIYLRSWFIPDFAGR
jgi:hypothetical protein